MASALQIASPVNKSSFFRGNRLERDTIMTRLQV
jgi:hypothetical protein